MLWNCVSITFSLFSVKCLFHCKISEKLDLLVPHLFSIMKPCISSKVPKIIICCLILVKFSKSDSNTLFFTILLLNILYFECVNLSVTLHALKIMGIQVADRRRWQSAMTSLRRWQREINDFLKIIVFHSNAIILSNLFKQMQRSDYSMFASKFHWKSQSFRLEIFLTFPYFSVIIFILLIDIFFSTYVKYYCLFPLLTCL